MNPSKVSITIRSTVETKRTPSESFQLGYLDGANGIRKELDVLNPSNYEAGYRLARLENRLTMYKRK